MSDSEITLLLTATIDPRDCSFVKRRDPAIRLADYRVSLERWLCKSGIADIIFSENSGMPLDDLLDIVSSRENRKRVRFLSYKSPGEGHRGKGYGELGIIQRAIAECHLSESRYLLKVTGRYYVENVGEIVRDIKSTAASITTGPLLLPRPGWIASECFCARVDFFQRYFCPMRESIDDSCGKWFEQILLEAIERATDAGLKHALFSRPPKLSGISGASGLPWEKTYSASAPILNPDGSVVVRDGARRSILEEILRSYIGLLKQPGLRGSALINAEDLLRRIYSCRDIERGFTLSTADLSTIEEAASLALQSITINGRNSHLTVDPSTAAAHVKLLTSRDVLDGSIQLNRNA